MFADYIFKEKREAKGTGMAFASGECENASRGRLKRDKMKAPDR